MNSGEVEGRLTPFMKKLQNDDSLGLIITDLARGQAPLHMHLDWFRPAVRDAFRSS